MSSPGNPSPSKGGAFAFRADLEIPSLYPPLRASLDLCHMAGAEKDQTKVTLLDRFFWNRSSLWGLKPGILVLEPLFCVDISVL